MQNKTSVSLGEVLCISDVQSMHGRLKKALEKSINIEIKAGAIQKVDTAGLQLIISLKKDIDIQGGKIIWSKPTKALIDSARLLGLFEDLGLHY